MGGRNAKPIQLHIAEGNPNRLTKAEIARREKSEIQLGEHKLKCPAYVKRDIIAYEKWKEIIRIYKNFDFVSSGDVGLLGRYCKTFSEYHNLVDYRERIINLGDLTEVEEAWMNDNLNEKVVEAILKRESFITSAAGILQFDSAINKKMDMLIKMEDRIFLTPLSKVKNVPKKEEKKTDPLTEKGFGNV
jgi:phage terminase small subunit